MAQAHSLSLSCMLVLVELTSPQLLTVTGCQMGGGVTRSDSGHHPGPSPGHNQVYHATSGNLCYTSSQVQGGPI